MFALHNGLIAEWRQFPLSFQAIDLQPKRRVKRAEQRSERLHHRNPFALNLSMELVVEGMDEQTNSGQTDSHRWRFQTA